MSTKRKSNTTSLTPWTFAERHKDMVVIRDSCMLALRLFHICFVYKEAQLYHWREMAGWFNILGVYAQEQKRPDWLAHMRLGAEGLKSVARRHDRVGGRWSATVEEALGMLKAIDCIDLEIMLVIKYQDFMRISNWLNTREKEE